MKVNLEMSGNGRVTLQPLWGFMEKEPDSARQLPRYAGQAALVCQAVVRQLTDDARGVASPLNRHS